MQLTLDELLWLEGKLRSHSSPYAKSILPKARKAIRAEAEKRRNARRGPDKLSPEERRAIEEYLKTNPVNVVGPPRVDLSGKSPQEVLAALGLRLPSEEAA